jgi:hypothetical protein
MDFGYRSTVAEEEKWCDTTQEKRGKNGEKNIRQLHLRDKIRPLKDNLVSGPKVESDSSTYSPGPSRSGRGSPKKKAFDMIGLSIRRDFHLGHQSRCTRRERETNQIYFFDIF